VRYAEYIFQVVAAELLYGKNVLAVPIGVLIFAERQVRG
jgi:hypothetical protein